ncbi:MAG: type II secretion system F family protein [Gammaproteobacteria bacterium]|nr:type II secretion system F family protein [Gammaproteobacteria bacterium]
MASLAFFLFALGAAAVAIVVLARAGQRERQESAMLRLRAMGAAADVEVALLPRDERIGNPLVRSAAYLLWRTGAEVEPQTVSRGLLVLLLLVPLTLMLFGPVAGVLAIGVIAALGYAWLAGRGAKRRALILEQLPGYLESVIRILSAGNTLDESLAAAARGSTEPTRTLFLSVGRQVRLGAAVEDVLVETAEIHHLRDLKVLGLAAAINRKYGGSLRNILKSLMNAVRSRDVAARELKALTAETRFSAWVLAGIVISLTLYIYVQNPKYYADMWAQPGGRTLLVVSLLLQLAGMFAIWRMVRSAGDPGA